MTVDAAHWIEIWPVEIDDPGDGSVGSVVLPVVAYLLSVKCQALADLWCSDPGRDRVRSLLPRIAELWLLDDEWCDRMVQSAKRVGHNIEVNRWPFCLCTADEATLQLVVDMFIDDFWDDIESDPVAETLFDLAPVTPTDAGPAAIDWLAEDCDIECLWDDTFDGMTDLADPLVLPPARWFEAFEGRREFVDAHFPL